MPELHFPTPLLADETLLLRPWREADVPDNLMAFSDSVIQRFSGPQAAPFTEEDERGYFAGQGSARLRGQECSLLSLGPRKRKWCWEVLLPTRSISSSEVPSGTGSSARLVAVGSPRPRSGCLPRGVTTLGLARIELTCGPDTSVPACRRTAVSLCVRASCVPTCLSKALDGALCSSVSYPGNSVSGCFEFISR
jgi:hypothetical protein